MRLKPEKVDQLAKVITEALAVHPEIKFGDSAERVTGLIKKVILADLQAEEALEADARKLLEQHANEINRTGASYDKLLQKAKQKLATERKMVL